MTDALLARLAAEGQTDVLAALEALADERIAGEDGIARDELARELVRLAPAASAEAVLRELLFADGIDEADGRLRLDPAASPAYRAGLDRLAARRPVRWAHRTVTQGEVLAGFAVHCRDELDDVELESAAGPSDTAACRLDLRWKRERSRVELRHGFVLARRLADRPTMLVGDADEIGLEWLRELALDQEARAGVALLDLTRLERTSAVRSSVFVYLEWFLRDAYGVKLVASTPYTHLLVDAGALHLGF
ncbi:MAG: hypothetical protein R3C15_14845 [Thermoleophilia bacterium]